MQALGRTAEQVDYDPILLNAVEAVNDRQKEYVFEQIKAHYGAGELKGRCFALWGLAFKPNTDDMREAASRRVMEALWAEGARVQAFDPKALEETQRIYAEEPQLTLCDSAEAALEGADALVIMTEWNVFRSPDFAQIEAALSAPVVFDGRNLYDPAAMAEMGFYYYCIGRPSIDPGESR